MSDENELQRSIQEIIEAGTSASTRRAYDEDVRRFSQWHKEVYGQKPEYPIHVSIILKFVIDHLPTADKKGLKVVTIKRYLASLSVYHQEQGVSSPTVDPKVKILLRRAKRALPDQQPHQKTAATLDILSALMDTCDDSIRGIRNRAIMMVGFAAGGRRRSEIASMKMDDLTKTSAGYTWKLRKSKNDQDGDGKTIPLKDEAAQALTAWLMKSGIRDGHVFRGVRRGGRINDSICGRTINRIIKTCARKAGMDAREFGAHSLRAGFLTESAHQGISIHEAMALSCHKTLEVAQGYVRLNDIQNNRAADLLKGTGVLSGTHKPNAVNEDVE